jgi:hypothetical protein
MRMIVRKEPPHPGARHRRRARGEDRIRWKTAAWPTFRCTSSLQIQIHFAIVALACEITTWMQLLALSKLDGGAKRLRLRLFSIAGQLVTTVRRRTPPLSTHAPGMQLAL